MFEWKYRAQVNETHSWEGRQCADISVEAGDEKEDEHQSSSSLFHSGAEEYADDNLFKNYEDEDKPLMDARLVNDYKPQNINKTLVAEPQAMPFKREDDQGQGKLDEGPNRQMDIPLTEVSYLFMNHDNMK